MNPSPLIRIVSGSQTGADQAGLYAAKECGLETGGWCPKGCPTTNGLNPSLIEKFGLKETESSKYPPRTFANAKDSDGTIRIAQDFDSKGEQLTLLAINQYCKPYLDIHLKKLLPTKEVAAWILDNDIKILNVAGNSERTCPRIFVTAKAYLVLVFKELSA